jgi:hypothetical protein
LVTFLLDSRCPDDRRVGGHAGQELGHKQRDHREPNRLVAVVGRGLHGWFSDRSRVVLHSSHRPGRVDESTSRCLC